MKENRPDQTGSNNPFYGKRHKVESLRRGSKNHMFGIAPSDHPNACRCHTPNGWFDSVIDAAASMKVSANTIRNRIKYSNIEFNEYYKGIK
jgi:hypothetical protein